MRDEAMWCCDRRETHVRGKSGGVAFFVLVCGAPLIIESGQTMSGILKLANNDLLILRDVASQYYLQAGQDSDPMNATAKLISGNLGVLQPSLFFQVHTTPIAGFWTIT